MRFSVLLVSAVAAVTAGVSAIPVPPPPAYYVEPSAGSPSGAARFHRTRMGKVALPRPSPADDVLNAVNNEDPSSPADSDDWNSFRSKWLLRVHPSSPKDRAVPNVVDTTNSACTEDDCRVAAAELDCISNGTHSDFCTPQTSTGSNHDSDSALDLDTDSAIFTPASYADDNLPDIPKIPQGSA